MPSDPLYLRQLRALLNWLTGPILLVGVVSLGWMILRAMGVPAIMSETAEITLAVIIWVVLFIVLSLVGYLSTNNTKAQLKQPR